jgi:hypothetical protein
MSEALSYTLDQNDADIAAYDVSEDGVTWRPFDPVHDRDRMIHRRIEFAPPAEE